VAPLLPTVAEIEDLRRRLADAGWELADDELIDTISALEKLKSGCAAAQAVATARFDASQRSAQAAAGVPPERRGVGVAGQIGLARRESPTKGARHVGLAKALVGEMPHTLAALARGHISEWRATLLVRETAALPVDLRVRVDAALAERLATLGDAGVVREARLVMTDATLLGRDSTPGHVVGHGPVPAAIARHIARGQSVGAEAWVRRLYTSPTSGEIVAMDSRRRRFDGELRHLVVLRDQFCRTPWCDAPIRHADHVEGVADGGDTSRLNGQGLCEMCNYAKAAPGWTAAAQESLGMHTITTRTATGHTYTSTAPDPPVPKSATAFSQQTERSQSSPSPSDSRLPSWCA
jgi:hypothetical protein